MNSPNVHNGTYTASHKEWGYFVVKLHTVQNGDLAGKRILSLLTGPNNETDYSGAAFWDDDRKRASVWKRHRGVTSEYPIDGYHWQKEGWSVIEKKLAIWCDLATRGSFDDAGEWECGTSHWGSEGYTLQRAGHCIVCNRVLTDPASIARGIGPTCEGRKR